MQYGINVPNFGLFADPRILITLARETEDAGWDGFFLWDHMLVDASWTLPIGDPWVALSAIAATTERIRLGPMVAALPRRRPWKVARETASLDILSGGRLILGVGLGWPSGADFAHFGDEADVRRRAEMLDEELAILVGRWSGRPCSFEGRHYRLGEATFLPTPVQQPRIPIWIAALRPGPGFAAAPGTTRRSSPGSPAQASAGRPAPPCCPVGRRLPDDRERPHRPGGDARHRRSDRGAARPGGRPVRHRGRRGDARRRSGRRGGDPRAVPRGRRDLVAGAAQ